MEKMKLEKLFKLAYKFENSWLNTLANMNEAEMDGANKNILARYKFQAKSDFTTFAACIAIIKDNGGFEEYKKYADWDERFAKAMEVELA